MRATTMMLTCVISLTSLMFCLADYSIQPSKIGNSEQNFGYEEDLVLKLLNLSSLKVRPTVCNRCSGAVVVNITYNVIQILSFSQAQETLSISGWFTITWQDYRLGWHPKSHGNVTQVFLPSQYLWLPDIGIMNGKNNHDFDFSMGSQSRMSVASNGMITWLHGVILDVTCPLDVSNFPFDTQTCYLILTPWQSQIHQLLIKPVQHGSAVDNSYLPNSNVSEWEIKHVNFNWKTYRSQQNYTYQYISISIMLTRQPLYFVILVMVPFSMLSALACLIFTLDDTGDRLSVALSLVLSMTMYVVIVSSNAPRSMRTLPVLCIYLLNQLGLLCVATVLAVVNNKLREYEAPPPLSSAEASQLTSATMSKRYHKEPGQRSTSEDPESPMVELRRAWAKDSSPVNRNDNFVKSEKKPPTFNENNLGKKQGNDNPMNKFSHHHGLGLQDLWANRFSKPVHVYRRMGNILDRIQLVSYLLLSVVNGTICLIIMPRIGIE